FRRLAVDTAEPSENPAEKDDPGKDDPGKDDPGKDDPGKDDPGKDDPGKNDSGKTTPGTGGNSGKNVTPKTGDSSHSMLWLGIFLFSGAGVVGTIGYRRRKSK
ncbi:MAG: LPXTG cell wall anchor domain-containing protein, partial [Lachnoclostridium sp.]|nr:LPXTG cell wall anchor domain-containing protein [Lachnoclostridium sp.]